MVDAARLRAMLEHLADAEAMLGELRDRGADDTFAEVFEELGRAGYLSQDLAASLASLARFRNLLVHGYAEVDDDRVVEILTGKHLQNLVRFRVELTDHLAT
jgi:uncharacterized protein YutE (UPF0331/DUF86 family)